MSKQYKRLIFAASLLFSSLSVAADLVDIKHSSSFQYYPGDRTGCLSAKKIYSKEVKEDYNYVSLTVSTGNIDHDHYRYRMVVSDRPISLEELSNGIPDGIPAGCYRDSIGTIRSNKCKYNGPMKLYFISKPDNPIKQTGVCSADDRKCRVQIVIR